ncbi:MAG: hypothetical protein HY566_02300, partial [Candidatus Kerfeldbacteria bacterium]|nr:hypothetical protein [Candidatus Kerfeldbacteria bacterium]
MSATNSKLILGLVLVALAVGVVGALTLSSRPALAPGNTLSIAAVGPAAFGDLAQLQAPTASEREDALASGAVSSDTKGIPAPVGGIRYSYKGAAVALADVTVAVLERELPSDPLRFPAATLGTLGIGGVDLSRQGRSTLQQFSILTPDGYVVDVSAQQGTVAISQGIQQLLAAQAKERKEEAPDVPADEVLVRTANSFLDTFGISRTAYGTPIVDRRYLQQTLPPETAEGEQDAPVSDVRPIEVSTVPVLYPLLVNDKKVFTLWGDPVGMTVTINIATGKVESAFGIQTQTFKSSAYPAVQSWDEVLDALNASSPPEGEGVSTVELAEPEHVLILMNRTLDSGEWRDLLVPGLAFPLQEPTAG